MNKTIQFFERLVKELNLDSGNSQGIEQFDDRRFKFGIYLINQDRRYAKIRKGSIDELILIDDITDWFHHGHLTFLNPDDVFERAQEQLLNDGSDLTEKTKIYPYRFRGDGRDMLYMYMEPHINPDEESPTTEINSPVHTMKFLFSIYATEDIQDPRGKRYKKQKIYFHDYRLQMLREKNLYYSTAKNLSTRGLVDEKQQPISQMSNMERGKATGEIIQDILASTLLTTDTSGLFSQHWEFGEEKMLYTSPSENKAIDDLSYVLDKHVSSSSSSNQPCILKLQRMTERWELLPVGTYFDRSVNLGGPGAYQDEYFLLSFDSEADTSEVIPPERKTFGKGSRSGMINLHYPDISIIDDYVFSEVNGVDCQEVLNSVIVHRYQEDNKLFAVDMQSGNIKSVRDDFQSLFISSTYGGEGGSGTTSWLSDSSRESNVNVSVNSSWSPNKKSSLSIGRNKSLLSALLLGNTINFTSRGVTSRRSGVFMAIDRDNNYIDSEYEEKVLGQYFITRVIHKITSTGEYENNIMGVKPYMYRDQSFDTNDMFYKDTQVMEY